MKSMIDNISWYLIIAIVGIANFVKKHYWQIAAFIVAAGLTVAVLMMHGCVMPFIGDTEDKTDNDHNGIPDVEDRGWDFGEWSLNALGYFVPGAAAVGGIFQAVRKTREASAMKKASAVQYKQTDRLLDKMPKAERDIEKDKMATEQVNAGVDESIQQARSKV